MTLSSKPPTKITTSRGNDTLESSIKTNFGGNRRSCKSLFAPRIASLLADFLCQLHYLKRILALAFFEQSLVDRIVEAHAREADKSDYYAEDKHCRASVADNLHRKAHSDSGDE